ncbi:MAG: hypothetical protein RLZZ241_1888 [Bacteroidota bacterium]|jgi:hypothetical protein
MNTLKQKKGFDVREYRFTDTKLYYKQGRIGSYNEIDIPFENIDGEKVSYFTSRLWLLMTSGLLLLFGISTMILPWAHAGWIPLLPILTSMIFLVFYLFSRRHFWKIKMKSEEFIYFFKNRPSPAQTNIFIEKMLEARNQYLRENYLSIDENLDYEQQYYNLRWLRSIEAISKPEFEAKYLELKQTVSPEKKIIGFTR